MDAGQVLSLSFFTPQATHFFLVLERWGSNLKLGGDAGLTVTITQSG
jgi:hypothetical protein